MLQLDVKGKFKIKFELKRHLSPTTVGKIERSLPLSGRAHKLGNIAIYFEAPFESGIERPKRELNEGDITLLPVGNAICFFYAAGKVGKDMCLIGKLIDNAEQLKNITAGDEIAIYYETG